MVLILGSLADPHVKRVCTTLDGWCKSYLIIDPSLSHPEECCWEIENGSSPRLSINKEYFETSDVTHVWWRVKPTFSEYKPGVDVQTVKFKEREWGSFLEGLADLLCQSKWINPRSSDRRFRYKGNQLLHAVKCGFTIPKTVAGNTPKAKAKIGGRVIYKPLTYYFEPPNKMTYTTDITDTPLTDEQFLDAPGIYQENITKHHELRITIVEDSVFCCRIDPTLNERSEQDWRSEIFRVNYETSSIDPDFRKKLLNFHRTAGIKFGAYDFIVRESGEVVFLEVNTVGQWLWIEERTGLRISAAIARSLTN